MASEMPVVGCWVAVSQSVLASRPTNLAACFSSGKCRKKKQRTFTPPPSNPREGASGIWEPPSDSESTLISRSNGHREVCPPCEISKFHAKESAVIYTAVLVRVVPRGAREQGPCSGNPWASTRPMGKPPGRAGQSGSYIYKFP